MDLRLDRVSCFATSLEKPSCLANRWKVSRHEGLAEGDSDESDENVAVLTDPFDLEAEEEGPAEVRLDLGIIPSVATLEQ